MKKLFAVAMFLGVSTMSFATSHGGHGGFPGHGHGGHGGHGHNRQITCVAKNLRGMTFSATGKAMNRFRVERRALDKCYSAGSRRCDVVACY